MSDQQRTARLLALIDGVGTVLDLGGMYYASEPWRTTSSLPARKSTAERQAAAWRRTQRSLSRAIGQT